MNSTLFSLNLRDAFHGLVIAVGATVFAHLASVFSNPTFAFTSFDWNELVKVAIASGIAYLGKKFLSDEEGKLGGVI